MPHIACHKHVSAVERVWLCNPLHVAGLDFTQTWHLGTCPVRGSLAQLAYREPHSTPSPIQAHFMTHVT